MVGTAGLVSKWGGHLGTESGLGIPQIVPGIVAGPCGDATHCLRGSLPCIWSAPPVVPQAADEETRVWLCPELRGW